MSTLKALLYFNNFQIKPKAVIADYLPPVISLKPTGYNFAITDLLVNEYIGIARLYIYNLMGWNKK